MSDTHHQDIPPHTAPDAAFLFTDPDEQEAALKWAWAVMADIPFHPDATLARACRVIILNAPRDASGAERLLEVLNLEGCANAA